MCSSDLGGPRTGIINIANTGPQVLAPAIAAPLVSQLGGYPALYLTAAGIIVLGSLLSTESARSRDHGVPMGPAHVHDHGLGRAIGSWRS